MSERSLEKRAVVGLLAAADRTRRHFSEVLRPWGLTLQQYNVLRILRGAQPEPLPTLEIGERMIEKTPGVSRLLDRLDSAGLVHRERCAEDRRQVLCSLTPDAEAILEDLDGPIAQADRACLEGLTAREKAELRKIASRVGM